MLNLKYNLFNDYKKHLLIYIFFILIFSAIFFKPENYLNFKFEAILLFILLLSGIFIILYSSKIELYKTCFIIILIFGMIMTFTTPTLIVCDESEHFARSDLLSEGILSPNYITDKGYKVSNIVNELHKHSGETITNTSLLNEKIDFSNNFYGSCFAHNPFYGYLLSSFGVFLAKILDLNILWSMWLGRLFNLLFYAIVCSYAVKKAPNYKAPLLIVSCIPLSIFQAASFSADCFIISVSIFSFSQFFYMYKAPIVTAKDLAIFFISVLSVSLFKFPYFLFSLLILLIKRNQFKSKNLYLISRIVPIIIFILSLIYASYASKLLLNSDRRGYFIANNVNPHNQINFLLNHPYNVLILISTIFSFTLDMIFDLFRFSHSYWTYESPLLSLLFIIYFIFISITYNDNLNFKNKEKSLILMIYFLIFAGIIGIQYLSWASVGYSYLDMNIGVYARYFIPLFVLFPIIFKSEKVSSIVKLNNFDSKIILATLIFLSGSVILTLSTFY